MPSTLREVLEELRESALDQRDKGDKFERLMRSYLRTDPEWDLADGRAGSRRLPVAICQLVNWSATR